MLTYVRRQLDGFVKNAKYLVTFEMRYATDAATGCMGVGGSRGESVWMVAAASYDYIKTRAAAERQLSGERGPRQPGRLRHLRARCWARRASKG